MEKVFIVTEGEYSDYHICAVFSDAEIAEKFRKLYFGKHRDSSKVEPWTVDELCEFMAQGLYSFAVGIERDGDIVFCLRMGASYRKSEDPGDEFLLSGSLTGERFLRCIVGARDEEHAVKIASERRTRVLVEGRWPNS